MAVKTYVVEGMTCRHCVDAVTREVSTVEGVSDVSVDLATGQVTVTSERPLTEEQIGTAIDEAGYELTSVSA
jgi:copper chaperone